MENTNQNPLENENEYHPSRPIDDYEVFQSGNTRIRLQSREIGDLADALAKAQGEMDNATKDSNNPFFKSKYSDLAAVVGASRPALAKAGISVVQAPFTALDGRMFLVTTLMHSSGQFIRGVYPIKPLKEDPQGYGSAMTYARRYNYSSMVGVASEEDDDGNAAMGYKTAPSAQRAVMPPRPPQPVNQSGDPITEPQLRKLHAMMAQIPEFDKAAFLEQFNVSSTGSLTKAQAMKAITMLQEQEAQGV